MKDRILSQDTKTYNLFQKYRNYKKLITSGRVSKYYIFDYPESIDVDNVEDMIRYIYKKEKDTLKKDKDDIKYIGKPAARIQRTKDLYGKYYTSDKVNQGSMSNYTFNNIINYGKDKVLDFSIDYNFTKSKFELTHNPVIFDIQDGMYDYMIKDNNIEKLYELIEEINLYNKVRKFILSNTSSTYNTTQKIDKLSILKIKYLAEGKDVSFINNCLMIIKDENYNSPNLYKAHLLLRKNIININITYLIIKFNVYF